jgi:hypothetical protein
LYPSFNGDEDMIQDVSPQEVIEEASKPHAFRSSFRSSHSPETWLELHQGLIFDADDLLIYMEAMTWLET